ncbi:MAG: hypothetical protein K2P92_08315 [Bdellovibrionaceae bacterium]|nr:hypothetical protein [Pseudobdellovibrionaceae bacterium]
MKKSVFVLLLFVQVSVFAAIGNFHQVSGNLFRGARPEVTDLTELQRGPGVETILNLEQGFLGGRPGSVDDEEAWAQSHHVEFVYFPMSPISRPTPQQVIQGLSFLNQRLEHKVFVHCLRGSDRTGIIIAAYRLAHDHWTVDQAFAEMKQYGHDELLLPGWKAVLTEVNRIIGRGTQSF